MRIYSAFALAVLLIPSTLNAGLTGHTKTSRTGLAMCREQWGFVQRAVAAQDEYTLQGLLNKDGVHVFCPDESVSARSLVQAADAWNRALGRVVVEVVTSAEQANVVVQRVNGIAGCEDQQGLIEVDKNEQGRMFADVKIDANLGTFSLGDQAVGSVLTHELGHFLGLDDLEGSNQIMNEFDIDHLVLQPSPEEAQAVNLLMKAIHQEIEHLNRPSSG
jgi:hypothetical protein